MTSRQWSIFVADMFLFYKYIKTILVC